MTNISSSEWPGNLQVEIFFISPSALTCSLFKTPLWSQLNKINIRITPNSHLSSCSNTYENTLFWKGEKNISLWALYLPSFLNSNPCELNPCKLHGVRWRLFPHLDCSTLHWVRGATWDYTDYKKNYLRLPLWVYLAWQGNRLTRVICCVVNVHISETYWHHVISGLLLSCIYCTWV